MPQLGGKISPSLLHPAPRPQFSGVPNASLTLTAFAPTVDNVGGSPIDNDYEDITGNDRTILVQVQANITATGNKYMYFTTNRFEQFGLGIHDWRQLTIEDMVNMDNHRYRWKRNAGDPPFDGMLQFAALDVWSAWRGGNPGAPLQTDLVANYRILSGQTGDFSGVFGFEVESPDGSGIIVNFGSVAVSLKRV